MTLLPPNATPLERSVEAMNAASLGGVPVPIRDLWNPATCPASLLPFLAWGISIDFWDADWTEAEKRSAIAGAIDAQRRKGTPASLREVLDRFDPMIALVEWFEDKVHLDPYTFRLELPTRAESAVVYDEDLVLALLRDIEAVKPLRAHMFAVHRLAANADAWLVGGAKIAGFVRVEGYTDLTVPADPAWSNYLETQQGEPIRSAEGPFLEVA